MTLTTSKLHPYAKTAYILISVSLIITIFYVAQHILVPLLLALLFAILLRPLVVFLNVKIKLPHVIAVLLAVLIFVFFFAALILFISWQITDIANDWSKIKLNLATHFQSIQLWIKQKYHLSYYKQQGYINKIQTETMSGNTELMGNTLNSFTDVILNITLIPIYTFLILLYRTLFIKFLSKVTKEKNASTLQNILVQIKTVIQNYIIGLLIQMGVVGVLTTVGLMILGVEYAIFLGAITAILNLIPYIGILIAATISILATVVNSTDISLILGVIILNVIVQFIDNNILVPKIVGNKVQINALASILGVVIGGAIAGISGMFLAIPLIAILKVVFDRIKPLEGLGYLMGDNLPKTYEWKHIKLPDFNQGDKFPEDNQNDTQNNNNTEPEK